MALSLRMFLAFESTLARASSRCSVETNSSFMASASRCGGLEHAAQLRAGLRRRAAGLLGQPLQLGLDDAFQLRPVGADPLQERRDHAVALAQQGRQQVQRLDLRIARFGGERLRRGHRLLGLDRQFVEAKSHSIILRGLSASRGACVN